jgi:cobalt-zinc-cadmium efflux system membrane fusion protein
MQLQNFIISKSSLAENESKLRREGFNPKSLSKAPRGTVWLISDVPESELNILIEGIKCDLVFPSFPSEVRLQEKLMLLQKS